MNDRPLMAKDAVERIGARRPYQIVVCASCGRQWQGNMCLVCGSEAQGESVEVARVGELNDALRLLAGGWYLDASSDSDYEDLFERGWLRRFSPEPGDYVLTDAGQAVIDAALEKLA